MNTLTTINVLLMLLGFLLQVLVTVQKAIKAKDFSFMLWVKANIFEAIISLLCGFVGLLLADDIMSMLGAVALPDAPMYLVHAFICGYGGREIVFRVLDLMKPKKSVDSE